MTKTSEQGPTDPERMTAAELQAEIGRLTMILQRKILGDPREAVTVSVGGRWHVARLSEPLPRPTADGIEELANG
jgi:hypothetical protein